MAEDHDYVTLYGKLEDKFGDNGVVAVTIAKACGDGLDIILWLMSCRVLKRDMECAMLDALAQEAQKRGLRYLVGHYYPTAKNGMVKEFYRQMGFDKVSEDENGNTEWRFDLAQGYEKRNSYIAVNEPSGSDIDRYTQATG